MEGDPHERTHWDDVTKRLNDNERFLSWHLGSDKPEVEILPQIDRLANVAKFNSEVGSVDFTFYSGDKPHWSGRFKVWIDIHWRLSKTDTYYINQTIVICIDTVETKKKGYVYELEVWQCKGEGFWLGDSKPHAAEQAEAADSVSLASRPDLAANPPPR